MALLAEKIVVTAKEFLTDKNINDCQQFNEPIYQVKLQHFDWDLQFSAASVLCEIVWQIAIGKEQRTYYQQLDRLFSPSPVATHCNFRGNRDYKTGNVPEVGAIAVWKRGNSWQGHMAIVIEVAADGQSFDVIEGRLLEGSESRFIKLEEKKGKRMGLDFRNDKLNLMGFIYPPHREIA